MLSTISMIMLGAADVAASVRFYRDTLGLTVQMESSEFAFLAAGGVTLALNGPLGKAVTPRNGAVEVVFPVAAVEAAHAELTARGCHFVQAPREVTPGSWAATFTDPDGHLLTVFGAR